MGGSVSAGRSNDELVDNLIDAGLIKSQQVERVFRAVDRGIFYLPECRESAYRDLAWREGLIHISAPCIYAKVMESLELRPSQYFLNVGSGSGYFSTMVGLILGSNGTNHNIELHESMIDYSKQKVAEFIQKAPYFDDFDFCKPKFVHGNVLNLIATGSVLYDRIYVGAGASCEHEDLIKNFLKVNGVCIMPLNDSLVKIKRLEENIWEKNTIMAVSYASLVTENLDLDVQLVLPKLQPYSLQEMCRFTIRKSIRQSIEKQNEDYFKINREMSTFNPDRELKHPERMRNEDSGSEDIEQDDEMMNNFERFFSSRLQTGNSLIDNRLRMMIYDHLIDSNINLDEETNDTENRALVLVRANDDQNGESQTSSRGTQDSGLSDGSQSSSLTESSQVSFDKQQSKKARKDSLSEKTRENLLRSRIMQLPLPVNVKSFILYYRDI